MPVKLFRFHGYFLPELFGCLITVVIVNVVCKHLDIFQILEKFQIGDVRWNQQSLQLTAVYQRGEIFEKITSLELKFY